MQLDRLQSREARLQLGFAQARQIAEDALLDDASRKHRRFHLDGAVDVISNRPPDCHQKSRRLMERFSERIQALSANQDLLVRNEWNGVGIEDLVRAELAHFADLIGTRILVSGPRLRLTASSAQAIGLALHE